MSNKFLGAQVASSDALPDEFKPMAPEDLVNHPSHYTTGEIECIDAICAALSPEEFSGFCKGNAMKYLWREKHKGGAEDLEKCKWYLDRLVKHGS